MGVSAFVRHYGMEISFSWPILTASPHLHQIQGVHWPFIEGATYTSKHLSAENTVRKNMELKTNTLHVFILVFFNTILFSNFIHVISIPSAIKIKILIINIQT